jgi:hypothetical protein
MDKHTKGPWVVNPIQLIQICTADARMEVARATVYSNAHESIANARLIATAPELLDELKKLYRAYVNLLETGRDRIVAAGGQCDSVELMEAADQYLKSSRAAIAKATGGEE